MRWRFNVKWRSKHERDSESHGGCAREVANTIEREVEEGHRSAQIDAHDLVEALLAIADRFDPPVAT
jgi:hypothetical protein